MTEPVADRHEVHTGFQQMDGGAVPHAVRVEPLADETGTRGARAGAVLREQISHAESRQRCAAVIDEEGWRRGRREAALADVHPEQLRGLRPQRTEPLFSSFAEQTDMRRGDELQILRTQVENLLDAGAPC